MSIDQLITAAISDPGAPIDARHRSRMEDCFQESFCDVRLHFSRSSDAANRKFGSIAFTVGNHICFPQWMDSSLENSFTYLLAHELSHVLQKRIGRGRSRDAKPLVPEWRLEMEASRNAMAVLHGRSTMTATSDPSTQPRRYGRAGHYYTAFYTALATGFELPTAKDIALFTQLPDLVEELDALTAGYKWVDDAWRWSVLNVSNASRSPTNMAFREETLLVDDMTKCWQIEAGLHSLTGGSSATETTFRTEILKRSQPGSLEFGLGVHSFGDSFAHRVWKHEEQMYAAPIGHGVEIINNSVIEDADPHDPDKIAKRPALYLQYSSQLYNIFSERRAATSKVTLEQFVSVVTQVAGIENEEDQITFLIAKIAALLDASVELYRPPNANFKWEDFRKQPDFLQLDPAILVKSLQLGAVWAGANASTLTLHLDWDRFKRGMLYETSHMPFL